MASSALKRSWVYLSFLLTPKILTLCPESEDEILVCLENQVSTDSRRKRPSPHFFQIPHQQSQNTVTVQNYILRHWRNTNGQKKLKPNVPNSTRSCLEWTNFPWSASSILFVLVSWESVFRGGRERDFWWWDLAVKWTDIRFLKIRYYFWFRGLMSCLHVFNLAKTDIIF